MHNLNKLAKFVEEARRSNNPLVKAAANNVPDAQLDAAEEEQVQDPSMEQEAQPGQGLSFDNNKKEPEDQLFHNLNPELLQKSKTDLSPFGKVEKIENLKAPVKQASVWDMLVASYAKNQHSR